MTLHTPTGPAGHRSVLPSAPRCRAVGHGRHPHRHRALLDGGRDRAGRGARWRLDARGRAVAGRQPDDAVGRPGCRSAVWTCPLEDIVDFLNRRVADGSRGRDPVAARRRSRSSPTCTTAGVPMALVTSSFRVLAEPFAAAVGLFDVVVSGDEVTRREAGPGAVPDGGSAARGRHRRLRRGRGLARRASRRPSRPARAPSRSRSCSASRARPGLSRIASLADLTLPVLARIVGGDVLDLRRAS